MDTVDSKIIDILKLDGRIPNVKIARSLKVSEGTVRRRIKKMTQEGVVNIYAVPDPQKIGLNAEALVAIQVEPNMIKKVAEEISLHEYTAWVARTTGTYDIFVWVTLPTSEDLGIFLTDDLGHIAGVRKTETFVNLKVMKRGFGPGGK